MNNEVDSLDRLAHSVEKQDNFVLFILLAVVGLIILFWFLNKKSKEIDVDEVKPLEHEKNQNGTNTATGKDVRKDDLVNKVQNDKKKSPPPLPHSIHSIKESSKPKCIGYKPINLFEQTEPLNFPYVLMPKPNCVIKFPQKGRGGRKGYMEDNFKVYLTKYFKSDFQFYDDRFILVKGSNKPFEPDFTLIDEKSGINLFLDVEIDEPYEGTNDIASRKATHFRYSDTNRNNAFKNRGWIVIRFAEIQVHQNPDECCLFVADVIASVHPIFKTPTGLQGKTKVVSVPQWTKEEAEKMLRERYRERYLGIESFGVVIDATRLQPQENELGEETEKLVKDEPPIIIPAKHASVNSKQDLIESAITSNKFISFNYENNPRIVKPIYFGNGILIAYCYIKNVEKNFSIVSIINPIIKDKLFTISETGPNLGLERIATIVNTAIQYSKFIRMKYTRSAWTAYTFDYETGEIIIADQIEAEESIRTISNIQFTLNHPGIKELWFTPNETHITSYCHKREAERMFRFDRISEIAILNI